MRVWMWRPRRHLFHMACGGLVGDQLPRQRRSCLVPRQDLYHQIQWRRLRHLIHLPAHHLGGGWEVREAYSSRRKMNKQQRSVHGLNAVSLFVSLLLRNTGLSLHWKTRKPIKFSNIIITHIFKLIWSLQTQHQTQSICCIQTCLISEALSALPPFVWPCSLDACLHCSLL